MKRSANLEYIQECLGELNFNEVNDPTNKKLLSTIKRFLNREYGNISECVNIKIINNPSNLFGMTVAPTKNNMGNILKDVLSDSKKTNYKPKVTEYVIEIDSKLNDLSLNLSNGEMTAILIHEIGHIVVNSKFIENMNMIYIQELSKAGQVIPRNGVTQFNELPAMLYIYNYIVKHQLVNEIKNLAVERDADKFVIEAGYGKELISALGKFAKFYSLSASLLSKNCKDSEKLDSEDAAMFVEYSKSFENRQMFIKDIIGKEAKTTVSDYCKDLLNGIIEKFTLAKKQIIRNKMKQSVMNESLITRLLGITPNITKKSIDEISVEIEMIETYSDKMYLIRKIHSKLDDINQVIEMSNSKYVDNKKKISILVSYKSQLEKMLDEVLKKKIKEKQYEVFVKSPKNYEG